MKIVSKRYGVEVEMEAKLEGSNKIVLEPKALHPLTTPTEIKEHKKIMKLWLGQVVEMIQKNLLGVAEDLSMSKETNCTVIYTPEEKRLLKV